MYILNIYKVMTITCILEQKVRWAPIANSTNKLIDESINTVELCVARNWVRFKMVQKQKGNEMVKALLQLSCTLVFTKENRCDTLS